MRPVNGYSVTNVLFRVFGGVSYTYERWMKLVRAVDNGNITIEEYWQKIEQADFYVPEIK